MFHSQAVVMIVSFCIFQTPIEDVATTFHWQFCWSWKVSDIIISRRFLWYFRNSWRNKCLQMLRLEVAKTFLYFFNKIFEMLKNTHWMLVNWLLKLPRSRLRSHEVMILSRAVWSLLFVCHLILIVDINIESQNHSQMICGFSFNRFQEIDLKENQKSIHFVQLMTHNQLLICLSSVKILGCCV